MDFERTLSENKRNTNCPTIVIQHTYKRGNFILKNAQFSTYVIKMCVCVCVGWYGFMCMCIESNYIWVKLLMYGLNNWMDLTRSLSENERNVNYTTVVIPQI